MTVNDQDNENANKMKKGPFYDRNNRKFYDSNPFSVIDREYIEILNSPDGKNKKSSLSTVIYIFGAIIFLLGALEGIMTVKLIGASSISDLKFSGIALLTAFITSMIFIGFGKVVELIIYRSNK